MSDSVVILETYNFRVKKYSAFKNLPYKLIFIKLKADNKTWMGCYPIASFSCILFPLFSASSKNWALKTNYILCLESESVIFIDDGSFCPTVINEEHILLTSCWSLHLPPSSFPFSFQSFTSCRSALCIVLSIYCNFISDFELCRSQVKRK